MQPSGSTTRAIPPSPIASDRPPPVIEVVVFDVGQVLIEWDPRHLYRNLFDGDTAAMERFLTEVCTPAWNLTLDAGRPFAEAVAELSQRFPEEAPLIEAYHRRWEEMVPGPVPGTAEIATALKARGLPLYLLTNFSGETLPLVVRRFPDVFAPFDGAVVSGEVGLVKPDERIFRHLLRCFGLTAGACLFIDDSPANVAAARGVGLHAHQFTDAAGLRAELQLLALL